MMNSEDIRRGWAPLATYYSQECAWDESAGYYANIPVPTFEDNGFLRLIREAHDEGPTGTALDIGCGTGQYSVALSKYFRKVVGVDFSGNMIQTAKSRISKNGISNVEFHKRDWKSMMPDDPLLEKGFDLVFARTTPAVSDADSFSLMVDVCRGTGLCSTPVRRRDGLLAEMWKELGHGYDGKFDDSDAIRRFGLLWLRGLDPLMYYEKDVLWEEDRPFRKALQICMAEVSRRFGSGTGMEKEVEAFLRSRAGEDGNIHSVTNTEIATVYWKVGE